VFIACCSESESKEKEQVNHTCVDAIVTFCGLSLVLRDARNFEHQSQSQSKAFEGKNQSWTRLSITDQLGTKKFEAIQILRSAYKNKVVSALEETTATLRDWAMEI